MRTRTSTFYLFVYSLILSNGRRTHQKSMDSPWTSFTHIEHLTIQQWTCPYPSKGGPVLNMFLCYLRSPGYNRKTRTSSFGGVSLFPWLFTHTHTHVLVFRYLQTHSHTSDLPTHPLMPTPAHILYTQQLLPTHIHKYRYSLSDLHCSSLGWRQCDLVVFVCTWWHTSLIFNSTFSRMRIDTTTSY